MEGEPRHISEDVDNPGLDSTSSSSKSRKRQRQSSILVEQSNPSCHRCKEKKIKCDHRAPSCRACTKSGSTCMIIDSGTGKSYTRSQIISIQERIQQLQDGLRSHGVETEVPITNEQATHLSADSYDSCRSPRQLKHTPRFIGDESGTGFIQYILHAIRHGWKDASFTQQPPEVVSGQKIIVCAPHALPSPEEGTQLVNNYLANFHIQHPFYQRNAIIKIYNNVYSTNSDRNDGNVISVSMKRDLFQLNLIFALASIDTFRQGNSQKHPFGFLNAGLKSLDGLLGFETIEDIQGFLLVAHFGTYYYIGCSIWEIGQICLRICIDLGLHKEPKQYPLSLLTEQIRRRVFWECYLLDRFSSVTLGRPFGIEDSDIEIGLPFDAEDEALKHHADINTLHTACRPNEFCDSNDTTVFIRFTELGRISSRIHLALHYGISDADRKGTASARRNSKPYSIGAGDTYQLFRSFYSELKAWRDSCPNFASPKSSSQTPAWFQFLYEREKLTLARAAIDQIHSRSAFPPKELLNPCHNTAVNVLRLFDEMRRQDAITYSWSYLQLMLSCGLSVIFCVFVRLDPRSEMKSRDVHRRSSHWWSEFESATFEDFRLDQSSTAINLCAEILSWMGDENKEMARYARFFTMMRRGILEKIKQSEHARTNIERQTTTHIYQQHHPHPGPLPNTEVLDEQFIPVGPSEGTRSQPMFSNMQEMRTEQVAELVESSPMAWHSVGSENTFDPLVRQLFGTGAPAYQHDELVMPFDNYNDVSSWQFLQEPLLAEFTSGLEGFMWEAAPP